MTAFTIRNEVSSSVEVVIVIVTSHCHIVSRLLCKQNLLIYLTVQKSTSISFDAGLGFVPRAVGSGAVAVEGDGVWGEEALFVEVKKLVFGTGTQDPDAAAQHAVVVATIDDVSVGKRVETAVGKDVGIGCITFQGGKAVGIADFEAPCNEGAAVHARAGGFVLIGLVRREPGVVIDRRLGMPKATSREQAKTDDWQHNGYFEFVHLKFCLVKHVTWYQILKDKFWRLSR